MLRLAIIFLFVVAIAIAAFRYFSAQVALAPSPDSRPIVATAPPPEAQPAPAPPPRVAAAPASDQTLETLQKRRDALANLPKGSIVVDAPGAMKVAEKRRVDAIAGLGISADELKKTLPQQAGTQQLAGALRISAEMAATLSGPGFKIEATTPEQQTLAEGTPTVWSWNVEATEAGDEELIATLYALIPEGDKTTRQRIASYAQKIAVSVRPQSWSDRLDTFAKEFDALKGLAVALFGLATLVLGWFGVSLVRRKAPDAPPGD
jgi:hypothetical protein